MMDDCARVEEAKQIDETERVLAEIEDVANRLEAFADRVIGAEPSPNVAAGGGGSGMAARLPVMASLRASTKAGSQNLGRIRRILARLEDQI
jgi:hypothetical protein